MLKTDVSDDHVTQVKDREKNKEYFLHFCLSCFALLAALQQF